MPMLLRNERIEWSYVVPGRMDDADQWEAVEEATELLMQGRPQEALMALRDVVQSDPRNPYAFHYLGTVLFELEQLEAARDAYRAAIALAPDFLGARFGLSSALRQLGDAQGAYDAAQEMLERRPDDGEGMYASGLALAALGRRREARRWLEKYLATGPELEVGMEVRGMLDLMAQGHEGDPFDV